jgi:hypothetical protein
MTDLLVGHSDGSLFVAGCKTNQGQFYALFDLIVFARIALRTNNPYGMLPEDRGAIPEHLALVQPQLRAIATIEIGASIRSNRSSSS